MLEGLFYACSLQFDRALETVAVVHVRNRVVAV